MYHFKVVKKWTAALAQPQRQQKIDGGLPGWAGQVCHEEVCMGAGRSVAWPAWVHDTQEESDSIGNGLVPQRVGYENISIEAAAVACPSPPALQAIQPLKLSSPSSYPASQAIQPLELSSPLSYLAP
eukprot:365906-Chlamydomonas_euryale.AAC.1